MRESVHALLKNLDLGKLKHLFWTELNYDRANQPLSTRNWDDNERALVSGDPLLLAEHGDFHIIYG